MSGLPHTQYNEFIGVQSNPSYVCHSLHQNRLEVEVINSDQDMREYCIDELMEYKDITGIQYNGDLGTIPLDELIQMTIQAGVIVIANNAGFVLQSVTKGQNLTVFTPPGQ